MIGPAWLCTLKMVEGNALTWLQIVFLEGHLGVLLHQPGVGVTGASGGFPILAGSTLWNATISHSFSCRAVNKTFADQILNVGKAHMAQTEMKLKQLFLGGSEVAIGFIGHTQGRDELVLEFLGSGWKRENELGEIGPAAVLDSASCNRIPSLPSVSWLSKLDFNEGIAIDRAVW